MFSKLNQAIKELGVTNGLIYAIHRIMSGISGGKAQIIRYYVVAQPVADKPLLPPHRGKNIEVRKLDKDTPDIYQLPTPREIIEDRLTQGQCLAAYQKGELCGYMWLNLGEYYEEEARCLFVPWPKDKTAWDYDLFIDPKHRLGFAFSRLWDEANKFLRENKVQWSVSRISAFNAVSLASHARLGTQRLGIVNFIVLGPIQFTIGSLPPYLHFSPTYNSRLKIKATIPHSRPHIP